MQNSADQPAGSTAPTLSQRLDEIVASEGPERLSFTELAAALHHRAWGGLLLIFAAINVLPLPPGSTFVFGLPVLLIAGQMAAGKKTPWFPKRLERRGVTKAELASLSPKMRWFENLISKLVRARVPALTGPGATRLIGVVCFLLALIVAIPVPLLHHAPAASISLFALALIYGDGVLVVVAAVAAIAALVIDGLMIGSALVALHYLLVSFGFTAA
jgi:hypothetical protein